MNLSVFDHDSPAGRWRLTLGRPGGRLAEAVDFFWDVSGTTAAPRERILPDACYFLIFRLDGRHGVVGRDGAVRGYRRAWISGLHDEPLIVESLGRSHLVGIRFHAEGAARFFARPMHELTARVVELDEVCGARLNDWAEQLDALGNARDRFAWLSMRIAERIEATPPWPSAVRAAMAALREADGAIAIAALARRCGISQQHLIRQFDQHVGLTPKRLARLIRFNRALAALQRGGGACDWGRLVEGLDYYDQPHFLAEFRRYTGGTPRELLGANCPGDLLLADAQVKFFQDPAAGRR